MGWGQGGGEGSGPRVPRLARCLVVQLTRRSPPPPPPHLRQLDVPPLGVEQHMDIANQQVVVGGAGDLAPAAAAAAWRLGAVHPHGRRCLCCPSALPLLPLPTLLLIIIVAGKPQVARRLLLLLQARAATVPPHRLLARLVPPQEQQLCDIVLQAQLVEVDGALLDCTSSSSSGVGCGVCGGREQSRPQLGAPARPPPVAPAPPRFTTTQHHPGSAHPGAARLPAKTWPGRRGGRPCAACRRQYTWRVRAGSEVGCTEGAEGGEAAPAARGALPPPHAPPHIHIPVPASNSIDTAL